MKHVELKNLQPKWLDKRTILLAITGSHAYGTNTEDSDIDYKGVCIPPIDYYLGLDSFNEYNNSGGKNFKNTKDDVDINIIHINKFVKDAMKGTPNNIEILFLREQDYVRLTEIGELLIKNRHLFLSKQVYNRFSGYAKSQAYKMKENAGRKDLIEKYGYDTKYAMHSVRLLKSSLEILSEGHLTVYNKDSLLLDIRKGKLSFDEVVEIIEDYNHKLEEAYKTTELPNRPDYNAINELLVDINYRTLGNQSLIGE